MRTLTLALVCLLLPTMTHYAAAADAPRGDDLLKTLRPGHPRLLVLDEEVARTKQQIGSDPVLAKYLEDLRREGEEILDEPTVEHRLVGPRLLAQSRMCLQRVYVLAGLYRIDGDQKWVDRAVKEMEAAAAFPDWNPSHFLDTAEMTHALAIGYDWLHPALTDAQRDTIRTAIVEKGLKVGREHIESGKAWWAKAHHNWNQVCNGGLTIGALAVADEEPELAASIIRSALDALPLAMRSFAPDGGWNEGPGYWSYTVRYTVPLIAAMESALGDDFGLADFEGFDQTGSFRLHFAGPTRLPFNYADAGTYRVRGTHDMYWLGTRFDRPEYYTAGGGGALGLFWHRPVTVTLAQAEPRDRLFKGVDVVFMRSAWDDENASYVGFKGGDNQANHSHLDLGCFVFDALGERWAIDLGSDDYNMPGYFGDQRWTYYRLNTHGQNTLLLNGQDQDPEAKAPVISFDAPENGAPRAVADLTAGYPIAKRVWRGVSLVNDRRALLVQDEVEADEPVDYVWQMHTRADVSIDSSDGSTAVLTIGEKRLTARVLSPQGATFAVSDATQPPPQEANEGVRRLEVRLPEEVSSTRVTVLLSPEQDAAETAPEHAVEPLETWLAGSSVR